MNADRLNRFGEVYRAALAKAVADHPDEYAFPAAAVPSVADRMLAAVQRRSFNKDGHAFRMTCKELKIACTYKAIDAYLNGLDVFKGESS